MNLSKLKRWFVGTPIATAQAHHERLGPITGLAVFASDNLSSVAYATEEILRVLLLAGVGALAFSVPIGLCIGGVIGIVILSYRQNIAAYPLGASDYIVAKDNLGVFSGLTAGAALLIDYTLTVAVSVSAGVAALTSAVPVLYPYRVVLGVGLVVLVAVANLRGIRESGRVFAVWSYLFIAGYALLMVYGFTSLAIWGRPPVEVAAVPPPPPVAELGVFLLLRLRGGGPHRDRGGLGRHPRVPAAGGAQRPDRARGAGRDHGHPLRRDHGAGGRPPHRAARRGDGGLPARA